MSNFANPPLIAVQDPQYDVLSQILPESQLPEQAYHFIPQSIIQRMAQFIGEDRMFICGKHIQRLIFYGGQKWEDWEQNELNQFYSYMEKNQLTLPSNVPEQEILRNLQAAQFCHKKTYLNINKSIEWKSGVFPITITPMIERVIGSGFMYVKGRDKNFRPLIIWQPRIISNMRPKPETMEGIVACTFMLEYVKKNLLLPGQVENWIILMDLDKLGLNEIPYAALGQFLQNLQSQYRCCSSKIFLLNVSATFSFIYKGIQKFLQEHTKQKIIINREKTCAELQALFAPHQLEKKFGGEAENQETNWWPPQMIPLDCCPDQSKLIKSEEYSNFIEQNPQMRSKPVIEEMKIVREESKDLQREERKAIKKQLLQQQHSQVIKVIQSEKNTLDLEEEDEYMDEEKNYFSDFSDEESPSKAHRHFYFQSNLHACKNKGKGLSKFGSLNLKRAKKKNPMPQKYKREESLQSGLVFSESNKIESEQRQSPLKCKDINIEIDMNQRQTEEKMSPLQSPQEQNNEGHCMQVVKTQQLVTPDTQDNEVRIVDIPHNFEEIRPQVIEEKIKGQRGIQNKKRQNANIHNSCCDQNSAAADDHDNPYSIFSNDPSTQSSCTKGVKSEAQCLSCDGGNCNDYNDSNTKEILTYSSPLKNLKSQSLGSEGRTYLKLCDPYCSIKHMHNNDFTDEKEVDIQINEVYNHQENSSSQYQQKFQKMQQFVGLPNPYQQFQLVRPQESIFAQNQTFQHNFESNSQQHLGYPHAQQMIDPQTHYSMQQQFQQQPSQASLKVTSKPFFKSSSTFGPTQSPPFPLPPQELPPTYYGWKPIQNNNKMYAHQSQEQLKVEELKEKYGLQAVNQYSLGAPIQMARFYVIKSFNEENIFKSMIQKNWSSTKEGNEKLNHVFLDSQRNGNYPIFLFFSVNQSGKFCGVAQMVSQVDFSSEFSNWTQNRKWYGTFRVNWIYSKDILNKYFKTLQNKLNDNKSVTNSRDTQEIPFQEGMRMLEIFSSFREETSIFDDFDIFEKEEQKKQLKFKQSKVQDPQYTQNFFQPYHQHPEAFYPQKLPGMNKEEFNFSPYKY